jgi:hypothetical protein
MHLNCRNCHPSPGSTTMVRWGVNCLAPYSDRHGALRYAGACSSPPPSGCTDGVPFFTHRTCRSPCPRSTISHRNAHASAGRSPCRNPMSIIVASRCPYRPRLCAVSMSSSTSLTVRYSRGRRAVLQTRRGGTVLFTAIGARRRPPFLPLCFLVQDRMTVP